MLRVSDLRIDSPLLLSVALKLAVVSIEGVLPGGLAMTVISRVSPGAMLTDACGRLNQLEYLPCTFSETCS